MDVPYEIKPQGGFLVPGNSSACFKVPFRGRSVITKFILAQVAGSGSFSCAFYNAQVPCEGGSLSDSEPPIVDGLPPDLYRVTPDFNSADGRIMYFTDENGGFGYTFFGQEASRLGNSADIYLKITNHGAEEQKFALSLGGLTYAGG